MHAPDPSATSASSPAGWRLERLEHGRLDFVSGDGLRHRDVDVLRAFPVTVPQGPVAIVAADGGELVWIESLTDQPAPLRGLLERALGERELLPVIERIEAVSETEPPEWTVMTDRGRHRFKLGHAEDIAWQPDGELFITDTVGMRYRIPDESALDAASRRLLERAL